MIVVGIGCPDISRLVRVPYPKPGGLYVKKAQMAAAFNAILTLANGEVIHDHPLNSKVNKTSDLTKAGSKAVFDKLYPKSRFSSWRVGHVFEVRLICNTN